MMTIDRILTNTLQDLLILTSLMALGVIMTLAATGLILFSVLWMTGLLVYNLLDSIAHCIAWLLRGRG
jgi:hypothetical protein